MKWYDKYNDTIWDEFACHFQQDDPCRGILHYTREEAAKMIADNYQRVFGLRKSRADAIRSMILNCK